ncbi:MAG: glycosyltransferase [Candidatus Omnitrophica bacterium]|nr:glycosyltransferase [Candidatus Omnitrophota bacterium]
MIARILPQKTVSTIPFWSVMIPSYNCEKYLEQALLSVLSQDPGPERMQIEVVDDGSSDNPKGIVQRIGKGRVSFYRNSQNLGPIGNFNECIRRSIGQWIHILHGDDYIQQGFYNRLEETITNYPELSFVATRCYELNEDIGTITTSPRVPSIEKPAFDASALYYSNPMRTPGIVICRKFYEKYGGFNEDLIHVADWEMWVRAITKGKGIMLNEILGSYRNFSGNHSSTLKRNGRNAQDYLLLTNVLKGYQGFHAEKLRRVACGLLYSQHKQYVGLGDHDAAEANLKILKKHSKPLDVLFRYAASARTRFCRWRQNILKNKC